MKKLNKKGSILQIVLVIFLIMTFALTSCLYLMKSKSSLYHSINLLMKQKNLEVLLTHYYANEMKNGVLFSDSYNTHSYQISYTVDDLGNEYEIITNIQSKDMNYSFLVDIDTKDYNVKKFEYREE